MRTRRFGTLTYRRSEATAENITLFERASQKTIALYHSKDRLAARGRFYNEDDLAEYDVLYHDLDFSFAPDRRWIDGRADMRLRIAHQWWGQALGWNVYHDQWMSEALTQYFAAIYVGRQRGDEAFRAILKRMRKFAIDESDEGPLSLGYRPGSLRGEDRVFRAILYDKRPAVLHMLRRFIGDEAFLSGVRRFYAGGRFGKPGTDDLRRAMEPRRGGRSSGSSSDGFTAHRCPGCGSRIGSRPGRTAGVMRCSASIKSVICSMCPLRLSCNTPTSRQSRSSWQSATGPRNAGCRSQARSAELS